MPFYLSIRRHCMFLLIEDGVAGVHAIVILDLTTGFQLSIRRRNPAWADGQRTTNSCLKLKLISLASSLFFVIAVGSSDGLVIYLVPCHSLWFVSLSVRPSIFRPSILPSVLSSGCSSDHPTDLPSVFQNVIPLLPRRPIFRSSVVAFVLTSVLPYVFWTSFRPPVRPPHVLPYVLLYAFPSSRTFFRPSVRPSVRFSVLPYVLRSVLPFVLPSFQHISTYNIL